MAIWQLERQPRKKRTNLKGKEIKAVKNEARDELKVMPQINENKKKTGPGQNYKFKTRPDIEMEE